MSELDREDVQRRAGGIVSDGMWIVLACPVRIMISEDLVGLYQTGCG